MLRSVLVFNNLNRRRPSIKVYTKPRDRKTLRFYISLYDCVSIFSRANDSVRYL